jgi:1-deoxy-D-xylulose-5-phosphate reductoisomerase
MSDLIEETLAKATFVKHPSLEDYVASDAEARMITENLIKSKV